MGEKCAGKTHLHNNQVFDLSVLPQGGSKCFDDDGRLKRTGTVWTASAHIITAVIGSGVLSLAWATAQLGWIASPAVMFLFSFVTDYTSTLLAACYRCDDPVNGKRNYTYMDAVKICGWVQYLNLFGVAIGYTIASSISMMAIKRSNCFHESGGKNPFHMNSSPCRIALGIAEIIFSQVPDFGFPLLLLSSNGKIRESLTRTSVGTVTKTQKTFRFQGLGDIAFCLTYSLILIEIQDTLKAPPSESKTMNKATVLSVGVTTLFCMLCCCMGYATFRDLSPGNYEASTWLFRHRIGVIRVSSDMYKTRWDTTKRKSSTRSRNRSWKTDTNGHWR
ncbi:Amino acid permease 2 [Gossypium arboreum]|uniref:Amino acid permease 2 n=1 Tax=Gossypium arboreum TaxID=29729 RepID=A0A0B0MKD4_GOSAR|nr:Amino acid permease 2 [Gossypium arboreum]